VGLDEFDFGQTPVDPEQILGLRIPMVSSLAQINSLEQANINEALRWLLTKRSISNLLTESFIRRLHKRMFGQVWKWAGEYRKTDTNIGVKWYLIPVELNALLSDVNYWIINKTYPPIEIAIRFKFRLVSIHCFPNGNGRHARLMADLLMQYQFNLSRFSWGQSLKGDVRDEYLKAIVLASKGNIKPLIEFAIS
jgi:Fic-DOC domain mobile mystery protein B